LAHAYKIGVAQISLYSLELEFCRTSFTFMYKMVYFLIKEEFICKRQ